MIGFDDHEWMLLNESTNSQIYSLLDRNFLKSSAIKVIPHVNSCVPKKECSHLKNEFDRKLKQSKNSNKKIAFDI